MVSHGCDGSIPMGGTMRAVFAKDGRINVEEKPLPQLGEGQVLIRSRACGICGSDLHLFKMGDAVLAGSSGSRELYLGHEFAGEIAAFGPGTGHAFKKGDRVCSVPFVETSSGAIGVGVNDQTLGAYSEYFVLSENHLIAVPDEMPDEAVALAEPLAVGIHAVERADLVDGQVALVLGCGPIGLACIAALRMKGVQTIVASDPIASKRVLAKNIGATETIDPTNNDEYAAATELSNGSPIVIIECIGATKLLRSIIERTPAKSTLVIAGVHTDEISFNPFQCTMQELNIHFAFYYSDQEYRAAFDALADGVVDWSPMITGKVGYDGIDAAFQTLMKPNEHVKVIIEPWRTGALQEV